MTQVLFVTSSYTTKLNNEANGTLLLATKLLQAGVNAEILRIGQDEHFGKDYPAFIESFTAKILNRGPKCVSFYTLWPFYHVMLRLARQIKRARPETVIVFGGPQASATARVTMETMEQVDYICTGEGENTVVPFFEAVLRGKRENLFAIPGLYYRQDDAVQHNDSPVPLCDLNTLPRWDLRLLAGEKEPNIGSDTYCMPVEVGRGCPFSCTFCCTSRFWKRAYRLKAPERIIEDIQYFQEEFGINSFAFSHDAFTVDQKRIRGICDDIIGSGLNIKWKCTARIDCITEELALKMKQAGMFFIEFGVESGSQRMQKLINKKLNLERAKEIVAFLLKNKIHVALFFMYGFPEETEQDLKQTLELVLTFRDMGVEQISMALCSFNPTTVITEKYLNELVLDPKIKALSLDVFGYEEEQRMIRENKAIFPFFYHLPTPLREEYQYLTYFYYMYEQFPRFAHAARKLYNGDDLRFYRDFVRGNSLYLETMDNTTGDFKNHIWELMDNTLRDQDAPYIKQLKGLLKFDNAYLRVSRAKEDLEITDTYDFSYLDFRAKRPVEQYSDSRTTIMLQKKDGKTVIRVLDIR